MKRALLLLLLSTLSALLSAQTPTAKEGAPEDITGWWVSVITEDWRWRMLTPAKGDFTGVPLNPEGKKATEAWDPSKDDATGEQCRAYGAPGLMRLPTRLHITWADDNTIKIETDEGTQTRFLRFGPKPDRASAPSLQGYSAASWDISIPPVPLSAQPRTRAGFIVPQEATRAPGSLKAVTTNLKSGYLRKNGVPYSANVLLTEYFTRTNEPNGESWLLLTAIVNDPKYLLTEFITSTHYKREQDGSKWNPNPCSTR
jgi:hypothetical protein